MRNARTGFSLSVAASAFEPSTNVLFCIAFNHRTTDEWCQSVCGATVDALHPACRHDATDNERYCTCSSAKSIKFVQQSVRSTSNAGGPHSAVTKSRFLAVPDALTAHQDFNTDTKKEAAAQDDCMAAVGLFFF